MQTLPRNILLYQNQVTEKITANAALIFWNSWLNLGKPQNWPKLGRENKFFVWKMQMLPRNISLYQNEIIEKVTANASSIFWNSGLDPRLTPILSRQTKILIWKMQTRS